MSELLKYPIEELEELGKEALNNGKTPIDVWRAKILNTFVKIIGKDRYRYRDFGPYWWQVKKAMIDETNPDFKKPAWIGSYLDTEWLKKTDYGNPFFNLVAAWRFQDEAVNNGLMYSNVHTIDVVVGYDEAADLPIIETEEYIIEDDELEAPPSLRYVPTM